MDDKTRCDAALLRAWLIRNRITASFAPTSLAEQLIKLPWPSLTSLRWLLTGADTLYSYPTEKLPFALVNNYGPTECTVVATSGIVPAKSDGTQKPSIGFPITNVQAYILKENLEPVQLGEAGELYLGGAGVARGYRNRPDWTAERFVCDLFSDRKDARMYRTGDFVRRSPKGEIEFLGRMDDQVKIRGYRIELDEIVMAINRCPGIETSAVAVRGDSCSAKQIVAYVVVDPASALRETGLRDFLRKQLPDYMQPTLLVRMDVLPLNTNGKLDKAALPIPGDSNIWRDQSVVSPQTPVERRLVSIVSSLVHSDVVSTHDNFFLLGGNSLLGTQVLTRVGEELGVELSLRTLFDYPTIVELAREIERLQPTLTQRIVVPVQAASVPSR